MTRKTQFIKCSLPEVSLVSFDSFFEPAVETARDENEADLEVLLSQEPVAGFDVVPRGLEAVEVDQSVAQKGRLALLNQVFSRGRYN